MTPPRLTKSAATQRNTEPPSHPFFALLPSGTLVKAATVKAVFGIGDSKLYDDIRSQLLPPPIRLGRRLSRFVSDEIAAMAVAIVGGATVDERRALVKKLVLARELN